MFVPLSFAVGKLLTVTRWQTIHRTYRGTSIPATACPAGANALISVISSALEVLVYTSDVLPSLRPTYGGAPCPGRGNSTTTSDIDFDGNHTTDFNGRAAQNGSVDLGSDDDERGDAPVRSYSTREEGKEGGDGGVKEKGLSSGEYISGRWPHEPRYCAKLWPEEGDRRNGSSATAAPRKEESRRSCGSSNHLALFCTVASSSLSCHRALNGFKCYSQTVLVGVSPS